MVLHGDVKALREDTAGHEACTLLDANDAAKTWICVTCKTRVPRKDLEFVSQTPAVLIRAKSWTMRGTTRLLQELRGWHLVCKVRRFGNAAKVLLTGARVRHTRDFASGQTRQEFRAYWETGARCQRSCRETTEQMGETLEREKARWRVTTYALHTPFTTSNRLSHAFVHTHEKCTVRSVRSMYTPRRTHSRCHCVGEKPLYNRRKINYSLRQWPRTTDPAAFHTTSGQGESVSRPKLAINSDTNMSFAPESLRK